MAPFHPLDAGLKLPGVFFTQPCGTAVSCLSESPRQTFSKSVTLIGGWSRLALKPLPSGQ